MHAAIVTDVTLRRGAAFAPSAAMPVTFRLATMHDEDAQTRFWASLSPESMYMRFFNGSPSAFRALSNDPMRRTVMLAELGAGNVIGLGDLLAYEDGGSAEVAFAVHDAHQRRGIARRMLAELTHVARARGIVSLTATVLPFNRAMLAVFRGSGLPCEERHRFDAYSLTMDLTIPRAA